MGFKEKLYSLRNDAGLSQAKLAKNIGVSQSSINCWEKGERTPSVDAVQKLADFFNITIEELLDLDYLNIQIDNHYVKNKESFAENTDKICDYVFKNKKLADIPKIEKVDLQLFSDYEPTYEDVERLVARNGKKMSTEQKMKLIKLLSEI